MGRARAALKKAFSIFSAVYADEPDLLMAKQLETQEALAAVGLPMAAPFQIEEKT